MIRGIIFVVLALSLLDLGATYVYLNALQNEIGDDALKYEGNPILKTTMKYMGLEEGMLFGGLIVFGIVFLLIYNAGTKLIYFMIGVFSMMLYYHVGNFINLLRMVG